MKPRFTMLIGILAIVGMPAAAADLIASALTVKPVYTTPDSTWQPAAGDKLKIECKWERKLASGEAYPATLTKARGRFLVDDKEIKTTSGLGFSMANYSASTVWIAIPGSHRIRCELDFENVVVETNETNNRKEVVINVVGTQRVGGAQGPQGAVAGALVPSTKTKSCKGTIYSTVQLDKAQFSAIEGVPESNPAKMTLDLVSSAGLGNYVHCEYRSVGKDVKLVYTFACPNAHQAGAKHIYACD